MTYRSQPAPRPSINKPKSIPPPSYHQSSTNYDYDDLERIRKRQELCAKNTKITLENRDSCYREHGERSSICNTYEDIVDEIVDECGDVGKEAQKRYEDQKKARERTRERAREKREREQEQKERERKEKEEEEAREEAKEEARDQRDEEVCKDIYYNCRYDCDDDWFDDKISRLERDQCKTNCSKEREQCKDEAL